MIQFIADGRLETGDRAVLWRTADYTYEIEIGYGTKKRTIYFTDTEYNDALSTLKTMTGEVA